MKCDVLNYKAYTLCVSKYGSKGVRWGVQKCLPVCIRSALKPVCVRNSDVLRGGTTDFDKRWVSHSLCFFPSQYWHYSSLVTFGCRFGNCCYGCKVLQNALFPSSVVKQNANGQSASKPVDYGDGWLRSSFFTKVTQVPTQAILIYLKFIEQWLEIPDTRLAWQKATSDGTSQTIAGPTLLPKDQTYIWKASLRGKTWEICSVNHSSPPFISFWHRLIKWHDHVRIKVTELILKINKKHMLSSIRHN